MGAWSINVCYSNFGVTAPAARACKPLIQSPSDHPFSNHCLVFLASYHLLFTLQKSGEKESRDEDRDPLVDPNPLCLLCTAISLRLSFWSRKQTEHPPAGPHSNFQDCHPLAIISILQESDPLSSHNTVTWHAITRRETHPVRMQDCRYHELVDSLCSLFLPSLCADYGA